MITPPDLHVQCMLCHADLEKVRAPTRTLYDSLTSHDEHVWIVYMYMYMYT